MRTYLLLLSFVCIAATACNRPGRIDIDLSSSPVRFIVDHKGWPRPFWWPRVTEFAIAGNESDEGDLIWHLKTTDASGKLAHRLAFIYGKVPPGFYQVFPEDTELPKPLERGRVYYVAAGGGGVVYRMAFSLPLHPEDIDADVQRARRKARRP